jgi:hypothetical protein
MNEYELLSRAMSEYCLSGCLNLLPWLGEVTSRFFPTTYMLVRAV